MGFEALKCCMQEEPPSLPSCSKPSFLQVTAGTRRDRWSVTLLWQKETCGMIFLPKYHNYSTSFKSDQTSGSFFVFTFLTFWREGLSNADEMPPSNCPPGGHFFCSWHFSVFGNAGYKTRWFRRPFEKALKPVDLVDESEVAPPEVAPPTEAELEPPEVVSPWSHGLNPPLFLFVFFGTGDDGPWILGVFDI